MTHGPRESNTRYWHPPAAATFRSMPLAERWNATPDPTPAASATPAAGAPGRSPATVAQNRGDNADEDDATPTGETATGRRRKSLWVRSQPRPGRGRTGLESAERAPPAAPRTPPQPNTPISRRIVENRRSTPPVAPTSPPDHRFSSIRRDARRLVPLPPPPHRPRKPSRTLLVESKIQLRLDQLDFHHVARDHIHSRIQQVIRR